MSVPERILALCSFMCLWLTISFVRDRSRCIASGTSWRAKILSELKLEKARPAQRAPAQTIGATLFLRLLTAFALYCFFAVGLPGN
jgi:hypothetical protein